MRGPTAAPTAALCSYPPHSPRVVFQLVLPDLFTLAPIRTRTHLSHPRWSFPIAALCPFVVVHSFAPAHLPSIAPRAWLVLFVPVWPKKNGWEGKGDEGQGAHSPLLLALLCLYPSRCSFVPPRTLCTSSRSFVAAVSVGVGTLAVSTAPAPAAPTPTPTAPGPAAGTAVVAAVPTAAAVLLPPPCLCWYPLPDRTHLALICTCLCSFVLVWAHLSISNIKLVSTIIEKLTLRIFISTLDKNI
jgi:hypothetical protein